MMLNDSNSDINTYQWSSDDMAKKLQSQISMVPDGSIASDNA